MRSDPATPRLPRDLSCDWTTVRSPLATWLARRTLAGRFAEGAADGLLRGPARHAKGPGTGRGAIVRLDLEGRAAIGKRLLHGGVAARCLGGLYAGPGRALAQVGLSERLRRAGIPTPEVQAAGWRRALWVLTAQALVTDEIPGGRNLHEIARSRPGRRRRREILDAVAALVRDLHDAGFLHADLNLTNIVLGGTAGETRPSIIDLDRGRFPLRLSHRQRASNLARLLRSHDKWIDAPERLGGREEVAFLRRYCGGDRSLFRYVQRYVRRRRPFWRLRHVVTAHTAR